MVEEYELAAVGLIEGLANVNHTDDVGRFFLVDTVFLGSSRGRLGRTGVF